jgi:NAD(P)-dependent dehydrogenase (short-subunit alcohol dehydrogenase family)
MTNNALIWGADGGIGGAIAHLLLDQGWNVALTGRHPERLDGLHKLGGIAVDAQVGDPFSVQQAVTAISQELEDVKLWVYAVGDITSAPVGQMTVNDWGRILDANLNGAFLTTHYSQPLLAEDAHLFYIGAVSERMRLPGLGAYAAAKAGLEALGEVVRKETRKRVTVVRPVAVDTPLWKKSPFKLPAHHLTSGEVAARILRAYQAGEKGTLDL